MQVKIANDACEDGHRSAASAVLSCAFAPNSMNLSNAMAQQQRKMTGTLATIYQISGTRRRAEGVADALQVSRLASKHPGEGVRRITAAA